MYLVLRLKNRRGCEMYLEKLPDPVAQLGSRLRRYDAGLRRESFGSGELS